MTESKTIACTPAPVRITRMTCPRCGGVGRLCSVAYSCGTEPTKCHVCRGRGVVKLVPLEDGEK